jgi:regulator of sirC expression with transglutaminase-like and TPR domain
MAEEPLNENELKALVSLLDDEDQEVLMHVENKIYSMGSAVIPFLEEQWENSFNPGVQKKIEELIHSLQFELVKTRLKNWRSSKEQDLLEGMWILATYSYPDLEIQKLRNELEQIYYESWLQFKDESHPFDQIKILNGVLFGTLRFTANTKNFHSPSNSMINVVLETKKGNPLTLCVIYMLVAQRLKMPVYGVNLPNLFILTYTKGDVQFYINAFNRGLIFSKGDIDQYISQLNLKTDPVFYEPCSNLEIIQRALRNLQVAFERLGETEKIEEIKQLIECLAKP